MKKRFALLLVLTIVALVWTFSPLDGEETVALARVLYANCAALTPETERVFGETVMNRVGRAGFGQTLTSVLREGFSASARYDERSLQTARRLIAAEARQTPEEVVWAVPADGDQTPWERLRFWRFQGPFALYSDEPAPAAGEILLK